MGTRIILLAAVALAAGLVLSPASAGPPGHTVRVGILDQIAPIFDPAAIPEQRELVEGLRELGYTPGRDVVFEHKSAQGDVTALPRLAAELAGAKPDVIVTPDLGPTPVASQATKTIPNIL